MVIGQDKKYFLCGCKWTRLVEKNRKVEKNKNTLTDRLMDTILDSLQRSWLPWNMTKDICGRLTYLPEKFKLDINRDD